MSFVRSRPLLTCAVLAVLIGVTAWLWWPRPSVDLPRLTAQEIMALTDSEPDNRRLLVHLTSILLGRGDHLRPWQELPAAAQPVWTTLCVEAELTSGDGIANFVRRHERPEPSTMDRPTLEDAARGYDAMGCPEMAGCLRWAVGMIGKHGAVEGFYGRFDPLLAVARGKRVGYQRGHVKELVP